MRMGLRWRQPQENDVLGSSESATGRGTGREPEGSVRGSLGARTKARASAESVMIAWLPMRRTLRLVFFFLSLGLVCFVPTSVDAQNLADARTVAVASVGPPQPSAWMLQERSSLGSRAHRSQSASAKGSGSKGSGSKRSRSKRLSSAAIARILIRRSIANYSGRCACPYSRTRRGRKCGRRSAYSKPGGASPLCYRRDVKKSMIKAYRASQKGRK